MIEDGHFKEMKYILDYVYRKRVENKKISIIRQKDQNMSSEDFKEKEDMIQRIKAFREDDFIIKPIEVNKHINVDLSKVVDLYDEAEMLQSIDHTNFVLDEKKKKKGQPAESEEEKA